MAVSYDTHRMLVDARTRGYSDTEVARRVGLTQTSISRIFGGQQPAPATAKKIAKVLGRPLASYVRVDPEVQAAS